MKNFKAFFLNVIESCSDNNNQFEKECQFQFEIDLNSFLTGDKTLENTISILEDEISKAKSMLVNNFKVLPNSTINEMINEINNHHHHEIEKLKKQICNIKVERDDFKAKYMELNKNQSQFELSSLKNEVKLLTDEIKVLLP